VTGPVAGQHLHYAYTGTELTAVTDPNGNTVTYAYDPASGKLQRSNDPNNQPLQTLHYDAGGRLVSIANGNQPPTIISTNLGAQQQTFLDPNGKLTTVLTYDDLGDVVQEDNVFNGRTLTTHFSYDAVGRSTGSMDPLGNTDATVYDETAGPSNGNVLSMSNAGGKWSFENYNSLGEPGLVRQPDGSVLVTITYDTSTGAVLSTQAPGQAATTLTYTADGQVKTVTDPGGRTITRGYDALGHLVSIADSLGRAVTRVVDAGGLVNSFTDQAGNQTRFDYNPDGTMAILTDANLHQTHYFYDSLGRLHQIQDPLGHSIFYNYDAAGLLSQQTDRNGALTSLTYDSDGLLVSEVRPNNDVINYRYDPLGRLIEGDTSATHFDRVYDDAGRTLSETSCGNTGASTTPCSAAASGQPVVTLSYTYGPDDQLTSVSNSDPAIGATHYTYDGVGRLSSVQYGAQGSFTFAYDTVGRIANLNRPNGVVDTFTYNASGDLVGRDATRGGTPVAAFDYGIDPATGQRTSLTDNFGTHTFNYAANGNLVAANHPASSGLANEAYSYDAAGNRRTVGVTSTFDAADRLLSDGTFNYTYDGEGNLISKAPRGGGAATTYTWNSDHQLIGIAYPDGTSSSYRYDAAGRRAAAIDKGTEVRFVNDGLNVAGDYNRSNQLQASYVAGLETVAAGQPSYYVSDGLGSVRALTDGAGNVTGRYQYNSFGVPSAGNAAPSRDTFTGYQFDSASGLYYAGARYYDSSTGRFLSEDPIPAVNPYPYAANDPTNLVDVFGLGAAAEYGELLMDEANAAQCVSGQVDAVASVSIGAAAAALGGGVPTAAGITADLVEAGAAAEAQCIASGRYKYGRPSWRNGIRGKVWNNRIERSTGRVRDRVTGRFMNPNKPWQIGHDRGYEFNKFQRYAQDTNMPPGDFRDAYNNPEHLSPELPKSNASHRGEDPTGSYRGS
jgi:RHS repeat-associated protein